jgi:hypothetical protein
MSDPYWFALALGGAGLAGMAAVGAYGAGTHGGHPGGGVGHLGHGHGGTGHTGHTGHGDTGHSSEAGGSSGTAHHPAPVHHFPRWGVLLSPRVLFSALVGFGAVGIALRAVLAGPWLFVAALGGGIAFEALLIGPAWNLLLRFGSRPALTLDHGIMDEAEAVTAFNAQGDGLVKLVVDGQVVQLLGTLAAAERAAGVRVRAGDRLVVESVDGARQRCTVSLRGPP